MYSHGNITAEGSRQKGPSSLHAIRARARYLQPVCKDPSMGCSINSAVCVCDCTSLLLPDGPKMLHQRGIQVPTHWDWTKPVPVPVHLCALQFAAI